MGLISQATPFVPECDRFHRTTFRAKEYFQFIVPPITIRGDGIGDEDYAFFAIAFGFIISQDGIITLECTAAGLDIKAIFSGSGDGAFTNRKTVTPGKD